ncbi:hypothetical protein AB0907_22340 [Streptomyces sp. NPDC006975]|uniref:hypothetical protein n=1 Tax=Streptomyces sp. NPDC006975 TaxID=3154310 RepID=UPI003456697E
MSDRKTPDPHEAAQAAETADEQRAAARPFSYPYDERRAGVRATRHISREQADADSVPGVPGGYGTTGGGQPNSRGADARPARDEPDDEAGVTDVVAGLEPRSDRED